MDRAFYPIICMACGNRGAVSPDGLAKAASGTHALRCKCGSTDIDLDTTPEAMQVARPVEAARTASVIPTGTVVQCKTDVFGSEPFQGVIAGGNYFGDLPEPTSYIVRRSVGDELQGLGGSTTVNPDDITVVTTAARKTASVDYEVAWVADGKWQTLPVTSRDMETGGGDVLDAAVRAFAATNATGMQSLFLLRNNFNGSVTVYQTDPAGRGVDNLGSYKSFYGHPYTGARKQAEGPTIYKPFCSLECNREYARTVVSGDTENNTEPYCLNCGKPTEVWEGRQFKARRSTAAVEVTIHPRRPTERVVTIVRQIGPGLYETDTGEQVNYDNIQMRDMGALLDAFPEAWHNDSYPIDPAPGQGELHLSKVVHVASLRHASIEFQSEVARDLLAMKDGTPWPIYSVGNTYVLAYFDSGVASTDAGDPVADSGEWEIVLKDTPDLVGGRILGRETFRYAEPRRRGEIADYAAEWIWRRLSQAHLDGLDRASAKVTRDDIAREILRTNPGLHPRLVERVASKTLAKIQEKG